MCIKAFALGLSRHSQMPKRTYAQITPSNECLIMDRPAQDYCPECVHATCATTQNTPELKGWQCTVTRR